jgi:hypothetical protein
MSSLYDTLVDDLVLAASQGANIEDYLQAREAGVTHIEARDVHNYDMVMEYYLRARKAGATHDEICDIADDDSNDFGSYVLSREAGATNRSAQLAQWSLASEFEFYPGGLANGVTHDEMLEACDYEGSLSAYLLVRSVGATHAEALACSMADLGWRPYARARATEATHDEILEAYGDQVVDIFGYTIELADGRSHADAMAVSALQTVRARRLYVN